MCRNQLSELLEVASYIACISFSILGYSLACSHEVSYTCIRVPAHLNELVLSFTVYILK